MAQARRAAVAWQAFGAKTRLAEADSGGMTKQELARIMARRLGRSSEPAALIHNELSGLTAIAAMHGLEAEEEAVRAATARLRALLPEGADLAAAGRCSFLVFLPDAVDAAAVLALARSLTSMPGERFPGCASHAGIALAPQDGTTPEALFHSAETALMAAREQGRPGYGFVDARRAADARRQREVREAVAAALTADAFRLAYQPIHHLRSGELAGFKALIRLEDQALGPIPPAEFIPAAEEAGLVTEIGRWALEEACRTAALWPAHLTVAVNLSPAQFLTGTLVRTVREVLERNAFAAYRLEVEITEGTLIGETELVLAQLRTLRDMGVSIALDDFGTGYSSLGYLWRFPFSKLKIDRSFVAAIDQSPSAKSILRSTVKLGHGLGMTVTAEGIETEKQHALLRDLGCDLAQGYHLGRPVPESELAALILRNFAGSLPGKHGRGGRNAA